MQDSGPPHHRSQRRLSPVWILLAMAGVLLAISGVGAVVVLTRHRTADRPATAPATVDGAGAPGSGAAGGASPAVTECRYLATSQTPESQAPESLTPGDHRVPTPPARAVIAGHPRLTLTTSQGAVEIELAADAAPCTVNSFLTLAHAGFYNGVQCHRLTTDTIYVLQCGDPSGSGQGGPGYQFGDENLPVSQKPAYPRGTVAMANGGPGTNGSQFFLVYRDSDIDPNYSVFGTVTGGLDVLDKIAAGGTDDSNGPGDGRPRLEVTITSAG